MGPSPSPIDARLTRDGHDVTVEAVERGTGAALAVQKSRASDTSTDRPIRTQ